MRRLWHQSIAGVLVVSRLAAAEPPSERVITVPGSLAPRAPLDDTVASTGVSARAIEAPGATAAELVARVPGVQVTRTGSSSDLATVGIRGATSAQTSVYLAGIRLNDDLSGVTDLSALPLFMLQGIHVYRGNSPIEADRLSIGGSIWLEPRIPRAEEVAAGLMVGSFGQRSGFVSGGVARDGDGALLGISHERAGNSFSFTGPDGREREYQNADATSTSAWSIARLKLGATGKVTALVHAYDREKGAPGIALVPNALARMRTRRLLAGVRGQAACDGAAAERRCSIAWTASALETSTAIADPLREIGESRAVWLDGARYEHSARVRYELSSAFTLGAGTVIESERVSVVRLGEEALASRRLTARPALTGTLRGRHGGELSAIASAELHDTRGVRGAETTLSPGGRLGALLPLASGLSLRANLGSYGRAPTLGELYGVSDGVRGNDEVVPERSYTLDAGVQVGAHGEHARFDADVFVFALATEDLIAYRQTGPSTIAPYNVGSARLLGAEAMAGVELLRHFRAQLAGTVLEPRDVTEGRGEVNTLLPFRSRLVTVLTAEVFTELERSPLLLEQLSCSGRASHRSSKYADTAGLLVIPAQTQVDLELNLRFVRDTVVARWALHNVLDARELDMVGAPLPGRSLHFSLSGRWQ